MKMKSICILVSLFGLTTLGYANKAPKGMIYLKASNENFERFMSYSTLDFRQMDSLIQLGRNYTQINADTAMQLIEKAIDWSKDKKDKKWQNSYARGLSSKGAAISKFKMNHDCQAIMDLARTVFEQVENQKGMASVDRFLGLYYLDLGRWENAADKFLSSIKIYTDTKTVAGALVGPYEGLSSVYSSLGEYTKAQFYLTQAITIADSTGMDYKAPVLRSQQAELLFKIGDNFQLQADTLPSLRNALRDSTLRYYSSGLKEADLAVKAAYKIKDPSYILQCILTDAALKNKAGDHEAALKSSLTAQNFSKEIGDPMLSVRTKIELAKCYKGLDQNEKGIQYAAQALKSTLKENMIQLQLEAYDLLIYLYVAANKSFKALDILEDRNKIETLVNSKKAKEAVTNAEVKYQSAEKEKKILKQENEILQLASKNAFVEKQKNRFIGGTLLFAFLALLWNKYNQIQIERNEQKEFAEALIFAQEEERKRIARDLHDGIGQSLLLIKKQLENTNSTLVSNQELIGETLEEVRAISRDLHPIHLEKIGLTNSIKNIGHKIEKSTSIFISMDVDDIDKILHDKSEIHLYRTVQEALSNVVKHSEATAANITVKNETNAIDVTIQDNGKGFDHELAIVISQSLGLKVMHERISSIGGKLSITPGKTKGTIINFKVPKPKAGQEQK